jgi:predicted transposase/invertase (TIGR01784 family)
MAQVNTKLQMQGEHDIESTRRAYFLREKARNDYVSAMTLAVRKGEQRGEQRGILKGKQELIKGMAAHGLSIQEIANQIFLTPQ